MRRASDPLLSTPPYSRHFHNSMELRQRHRNPDGNSPSTGSPSQEKRVFEPSWRSLVSWKLWLLLTVYWVSLVQYFERTRVTQAMNACEWGQWEQWPADSRPHRVALIADPQLVDDHTYPTLPRLVSHLLRKMSDNYLYINHKYMQTHLDPDTTIFVGDLFDGGREWEDSAWIDEYHRFNRIFPERSDKRSYRGLPGNHDIGFQNISTAHMERFAAHFGQANDYFVLGNHTVLQLDTISMSHEDPEIHSQARAFFQTCQTEIDPDLPRIVLTHVPLYRDPTVETCAVGRESKRPFPLQRGFQYQTVIDYYPYSNDILKQLKPSLVISGDDHDVCDMEHVDYADNKIKLAREISCKTASMTNGIRYPAIHLLSLNNPNNVGLGYKSNPDESTIQTTMCLLPRPYLGVKVYAASLLICYVLIYLSTGHGPKIRGARDVPRKRLVCLQCAMLFVGFLCLWFNKNEM